MLRVDTQDKEKLIEPLFRTNPAFLAGVAITLIFIGWGVYMYIRQLTLGLGETGMDRPTYWGMYMVNFIFFIGISHAGTLISAILRVTGAEWRRPITRVAEAITAFALIVGTLQIIIDMGRPDRLLFTITKGRLQSPILWDVVSVTAYFLGSITYLYLPLIPDAAIVRDNCPDDAPAWQKRLYSILALGWRGNREQWLRLEKAIAVMAIVIIPVAVSVHSIISWILATTVQPGWHSSIFGPYFVVGAIFSGIGALFIAMTAIRSALGLEKYITLTQYRNLGLLFLTMAVIWGYFTYTEHLGIAAGQLADEFPVLAAKLWGEFATPFWVMIIAMIAAFIVLAFPAAMPKGAVRLANTQPWYIFAPAASAAAMLIVAYVPLPLPVQADVEISNLAQGQAFWVVFFALAGVSAIGLLAWLKDRRVHATIIAALLVLVGMWLERWLIIVPTMTHPRLIPYSTYQPTLTEISLSLASVSLFIFLFLIFFRLFPAVSIWEIAEGRVVAEANAQISIPEPEPNRPQRRLRGFRRLVQR